jgi:hypothetical protein
VRDERTRRWLETGSNGGPAPRPGGPDAVAESLTRDTLWIERKRRLDGCESLVDLAFVEKGGAAPEVLANRTN